MIFTFAVKTFDSRLLVRTVTADTIDAGLEGVIQLVEGEADIGVLWAKQVQVDEGGPHAALGTAVKTLRGPLPQSTIAHRAGISPLWFRKIEGGRTNPSLSTLAQLAKGLDVSLRDLVGLAEDLEGAATS